MTNEQMIRREMARGNEYRKVIMFAIKTMNEIGYHSMAAMVVQARNHADETIEGMFR